MRQSRNSFAKGIIHGETNSCAKHNSFLPQGLADDEAQINALTFVRE